MKNENETNEAQRYAENIAAHLYAWGVAAEYVEARSNGDANDEDGELLGPSEWAEGNGYKSAVADDAADIANGQMDDVDTIADAWNLYLGDVLCVELVGKHDGNGWTVTGAEVTVTYGGPSCWIEWNGASTLTVRAAWGSDTGVTRVDCDGLVAALDSYVEGVTL